MKRFSLLLTIFLGAVVLLIACAAPTPSPVPPPTAAPTPAPPILTVVGAQTKTFTLADLKKLPAASGQGGIKSSTGRITIPQPTTGVRLLDIIQQVGGGGATMAVQIEASDGYAMTFSYDQMIKGDFITYDPGTGDEVKRTGTMDVILAYEINGKPLNPQTDGNLRLMVISEKNNQVVDGHWSVKFVNKVSLKPLAAEWSLPLEGAITEKMDRGTFESCSAATCHQATWKDDKAQTWVGTPLYLLAARVDDENKHDTGAFNVKLAEQGYKIDVVSKDGLIVPFDSQRVKNNRNIIVAFMVNGNPLSDKDFPLRLVGPELSGKESVSGIGKIVLHLDPKALPLAATPTPAAAPTKAPTPNPPPAAGSTSLALGGLVSKPLSWTLAELKKLEVVKLNLEVPKKGKQDVTGVRLNALLDLAAPKPEAKKLLITAADGFSAEAELKDVRACRDCLVSFEEDGTLKLVMPDLATNFWVKNVAKLEVK